MGEPVQLVLQALFVALRLAVNHLLMTGALAEDPIKRAFSRCQRGHFTRWLLCAGLRLRRGLECFAVDMNIVMTESGEFVEIQGTGEEATFSGDELNAMLFLWKKTGIEELIAYQKEALYALASEEVPSQDSEEKVIVIATRNPGKAKEFSSIFLVKKRIYS